MNNGQKHLTIFANITALDIYLGSEYVSGTPKKQNHCEETIQLSEIGNSYGKKVSESEKVSGEIVAQWVKH